MTDRELLELAAKAAGMKILGWLDGVPDVGCARNIVWWNPLTDDGDALRLAVKLELKISHRTVDVDVSRGNASASVYVPTYSGREEATRRAIVRAAAEIGRAMP